MKRFAVSVAAGVMSETDLRVIVAPAIPQVSAQLSTIHLPRRDPAEHDALNAEFQCEIAWAQLCGLGDYRLRTFVTVQTPEESQQWMDERVKELSEPHPLQSEIVHDLPMRLRPTLAELIRHAATSGQTFAA